MGFMATISIILCCFILISNSLSAFSWEVPEASPIVKQSCRATRDPAACQSMISATGLVPSEGDSTLVVQAAFSASLNYHTKAHSMITDLLGNASIPNYSNISRAALPSINSLLISADRIRSATRSLSKARVRDARALASAALSYQHDCWYNLKTVNNTMPIVWFLDGLLTVSTSNALSMLLAIDTTGLDPQSWTLPPRTERDGVWENVDKYGFTNPVFNFTNLRVDVTVSKDFYGGSYTTVQEAVDAAPSNLKGWKWHVIKIKEGVYEEMVRVPYNKTNLVFLGDGVGKTVITGSAGFLGITAYDSATVGRNDTMESARIVECYKFFLQILDQEGVLGDGFRASGITFQNTARNDTNQAVAFRSSSDLSFIENCEFLGSQNTLYAHSLRQIYKSCHIEGTMDFISGNAAAIFQNCTILVRPRQLNPDQGESNVIAAHGRTDPAQTTGFAFIGCLINGTNDYMRLYSKNPSVHKNYLGRPREMYSRTVYINCTMDEIISPEGWMPWDKDFAMSTLFYGEFGNTGKGGVVSKRVPWSKQIPQEYVSTYYVHNFVQGDEWITLTS
ncbi:hypothetical protein RND81_03G005900 [Saponaria officinalis]|uniref:pectinesterase n=1 Tax=Saponaria officinalis TaxID=3572 RepID=A0AAW1M1P7_SAPOF